MNQLWFPEAAVRSLVMGAIIFAVLKVLRIRQVQAQRTAWVLALLAAVAMPALTRWPVGPSLLPFPTPFSNSFRTPFKTQTMPASAPLSTFAISAEHRPSPGLRQLVADGVTHIESQPRATAAPHSARILPADTALPPVVRHAPYAWPAALRATLARSLPYGAVAYGLMVVLLLARLAVGLALALRLRHRAVPVAWHDWSAMEVGEDIRISSLVQTPVTIASSILLPESSEAWDAAKLRMVLAHERAHVRQADFYIHLLAGLHSAVFWFSPFSWWLQRRLSALGEAISDLAALQQADSRASYAEVLLDFARSVQGAQPPSAAVAMARRSNLRTRIERLLNDRLYTEAFSARRRHPFLAASIVPIALLGSASLVRVHAAVQAPTSALANGAPGAALALTPDPVVAPQPAPLPAPAAVLPALSATPAVAPTVQAQRQAATPSPAPEAGVVPLAAPTPAPIAMPQEELSDTALASETMGDEIRQVYASAADAEHEASSYAYGTWNGDSYSLVTSEGGIHFDSRFRNLIRKSQGDFIYYQHDGKSYVIQDPALLAEAKALQAPMEELGRRQGELGRKQAALGAQQAVKAHLWTQVKISPDDYAKQVAELHQLLKSLESAQASNAEVSQQELAELQRTLGQMQGQLGALQGKVMAASMRDFASEQGELGAEQGKLGAEQGRLGAQQGRLAMEAQRKMKPLLDQAIKDGRAKPVE